MEAQKLHSVPTLPLDESLRLFSVTDSKAGAEESTCNEGETFGFDEAGDLVQASFDSLQNAIAPQTLIKQHLLDNRTL